MEKPCDEDEYDCLRLALEVESISTSSHRAPLD